MILDLWLGAGETDSEPPFEESSESSLTLVVEADLFLVRLPTTETMPPNLPPVDAPDDLPSSSAGAWALQYGEGWDLEGEKKVEEGKLKTFLNG